MEAPTAIIVQPGKADEASASAGPQPGARAALVLLLLINLFNYIDRQILAAVEPEIRKHLLLSTDVHDPNTRAKMGLLSTAFLLTYMTIAPVFGILAERRSRWLLIAVGVGLWSVASGVSGLASTFAALLITRCFVGIGEAAYGPVAPTVIADLYPVASRGKVMAWFYVAIPVGGALGYAVGGQFAAFNPAQESWRWAFYAVVPPGLLLGLWCMFMREPPRGAADLLHSPARKASMKDYGILLRTPSYVLDTVGMMLMTFAIGGIAWWMPDYLEQRGVEPLWGIEPRTAFGAITAAGGLIATLAGGVVGDRLRARLPGSYFLVSGVALVAGAPCFLLVLITPFPFAWIFIFLSVFLLFFNTGPTNTILANVTHPSMRATAFALNILVIHALGDAISPPIIGAIADRWSLGAGFVVVCSFMVIGGFLWLWGSRYLASDTSAAPRLLDGINAAGAQASQA